MAVKTAWIRQRVNEYFVYGDNNCTMTVLQILGEHFDTPINADVVGAAQCMPGAGGMGKLCGLVSGLLMFVGVWGKQQGIHRAQLAPITNQFMDVVQQRFGSTDCDDLRRAGGCAPLAVELLELSIPVLRAEMEDVGRMALS
jgi:C_GCAxxG_C_C family probable redox protein